ncbi:MAG: DegT/DnrJ/EryC1/StrS family aminotransferase [bacterium]|nr:DegT/DnrJ/EryC1/StrS family aminotransferase [bacterium]
MMNRTELKRRSFLHATSAGAAGLSLATPRLLRAAEGDMLAVKGGTPVRTEPFHGWPVLEEADLTPWREVLEKKAWSRYYGSGYVSQFEKEYAQAMGVKDCLAVTNGTNALLCALDALDVGPGDEVLVPPYTFVATVNVVLMRFAVPVFVDTDRNTFQMDPAKIEEKITSRTRCIIPVHFGGNSVELDQILAIAKKHNLYVIEDACQSHLAEWREKKVGTWGDLGCFSFQVTKNLSSGEGGAVISDNTDLMDRCIEFHNNGSGRKRYPGIRYNRNGINQRMTEFQGAILLQGLKRLEAQAAKRDENGAYLTEQLNAIPGIRVMEMYEGCTRNAYHVYSFRFDRQAFAGISKDAFLQALNAEGIPAAGGYSRLNKEPFWENTLRSRPFQAIYSPVTIDRYVAENECLENDRLCEEAAWLSQQILLGTQKDMDDIATAVRKVHKNAELLAKA